MKTFIGFESSACFDPLQHKLPSCSDVHECVVLSSSCLRKTPQFSIAKLSTSVSASIIFLEVVSCKCNSGYVLAARSEHVMKTKSLSPLDRLTRKDTHSAIIHREFIKLLRQVRTKKNRHRVKKDESDMWYKTSTFVMVNKDYKSNFLEVL